MAAIFLKRKFLDGKIIGTKILKRKFFAAKKIKTRIFGKRKPGCGKISGIKMPAAKKRDADLRPAFLGITRPRYTDPDRPPTVLFEFPEFPQFFLAQFGAPDLAGMGLGEFCHKFNGTRVLIGCRGAFHVILDLFYQGF